MKYTCYHTIWQGEFTSWPDWYKETEDFEVMISDIVRILGSLNQGAEIVVLHDQKSKEIFGYSIKQHDIEIETSTSPFMDEDTALQVLEQLILNANPKYIIRYNIKDNELQVYKKLGYNLPSDIVILEKGREKSSN